MRGRLKYKPSEIEYLAEKGINVGEDVASENVLAWNLYMLLRGRVRMTEIAALFDIYGIDNLMQRQRLTYLVVSMARVEAENGSS